MYRLLVIAISVGVGLAVGAAWRWTRRRRTLTVPAEWFVMPRPARALMNEEEFPGG
jgi:hypothetical protein